uniref:Uncharacterized protein n=1 Tax=Chromera velia CCMP2878 TaxID=1169474 RepID=A0A0G4GUD9_9ALVE|mmetsp:Transcript_54016/g.105643  ORF Transcript_54016/g.105643 Transcript_54016/m.105643 type:complete len:244 (+) Transcript_54016:348-1079(+)|eukprot:Cvel_5214.t1-p1 / transcript=Cvel_5214.t1 / gene=Cvel_5214 / organism=Chromera_velia_CCMP2878 / gene_product=hypothetical protein / transcript_product=hypothetical protein / location=Cvel_scaffold240:29355-32396(+) / protein_length=243 / sequence_SO=supercontig / SO=protein_coding / is_pseudo=false
MLGTCNWALPSCGFLSGQIRAFSCGAVDRAVRELPTKSRFDLLKQRKAPRYMSECPGTPRRDSVQENLIDGIRVRPTFNPYVRIRNKFRWPLDRWKSRDWENWRPDLCYVRGSRKPCNVPDDFLPTKDELGEMHPPKISGRYRADIRKQYHINGLPWMWAPNFYTGSMHFHDRPLLGPKMFYRQEYKKEVIKEAMRKMDELYLEHRRERRNKKAYTYFEKAVLDMTGDEIAYDFVRQRKVPKL